MSKYDPLREHLARLEDVVWAAKLDDLEEILGSALPRSAREHRTWWANSGGSLVHQNAWLDAGWRVERTDLPRDVVVFRRLRIGGTALANGAGNAGRPRAETRVDQDRVLTRKMAHLRQPVTVTLRAEWTAIGDARKVRCSENAIPAGPGILRVALLDGAEPRTVIFPTEAIQAVYRQIRLAMKGLDDAALASADPSLIKALGLKRATPIECDVVRSGNAWLLTDGRGRKANLEEKAERDLVGHLLYIQEIQCGLDARMMAM
ncbi:hypothetical protein GCM10011316_19640 [Roseibium aquae]|uniref:DUF7662 domain-containing protein n=1 Tax=Roseibium aquae TaxID=1323746 RepID=A0A916X0K5_9HYPH|nr:hypothetical protein [Roseibium aquae]GGB47556.1 hypothetical protein GCM10011316_19640 [Roseibium aquae]